MTMIQIGDGTTAKLYIADHIKLIVTVSRIVNTTHLTSHTHAKRNT